LYWDPALSKSRPCRVHKRVVAGNGFLERLRRHRVLLILVLDGGGQPGIVSAEKKKPASRSTHGGATVNFSRSTAAASKMHKSAAAGAGAAIQAHGGRKVAHGIPLVIGRAVVIVLLVIWAGLEGSGALPNAPSFVIKPHTDWFTQITF